jgi:hypothetical protein
MVRKATAPKTAATAPIGSRMLNSVALFTILGGFLADVNRTHLFNPRWTPHSKFHSAWTVLLGASLGSTALYLFRRRQPDQLLGAALLGQFWAGQAISFAFPNTASITREFPDSSDRPPGAKLHEGVVSALMLALTGVGLALHRPAS